MNLPLGAASLDRQCRAARRALAGRRARAHPVWSTGAVFVSSVKASVRHDDAGYRAEVRHTAAGYGGLMRADFRADRRWATLAGGCLVTRSWPSCRLSIGAEANWSSGYRSATSKDVEDSVVGPSATAGCQGSVVLLLELIAA